MGAGAYVGAVLGMFQARVVPHLVGATLWLISHRDLGPRYMLENTGTNASTTVLSYSVSSILGVTAVGDMQAANLLMGPFKIIVLRPWHDHDPRGGAHPAHFPEATAAVLPGR